MTNKMTKRGLLIVLTVIAFACNKAPVIDVNEKEWLKNHHDLIVGLEPNTPPYQFVNEKGEEVGIFIDFLKIIESRLNYKFNKIYQSDFPRLLIDTKAGNVDIILQIQKTDERKKYLNFTPILISHNHVIVVRKSENNIDNIADLKTKNIAVVNKYAVQEYLTKTYPNYNLIPFSHDVVCLRAVSTGQADAFICQQAVATYYIETEGISNLEIAGEIDYSNELAIASRNNLDTLNTILSKAVNSITKTEKQNIYSKWLSNEVKPFYAEAKFWIVNLLVILVVLTLAILFNIALRNRVKQKTKELTTTKEKVEESEERYRSLMLNLETGIVVHAPDTSILLNNTKASELLGISDDQMKGKATIDRAWEFVTENNMPLPLEEYPVSQIVSNKKPIKNQILGIHRSGNNDVVWVLVNGFPALNDKGEIIEIIISFIDITDSKQAEQKVMESQAELTKALESANQSRQTLLSVLEDQQFAQQKLNQLNAELEQRVAERTSQLQAANKELETFTYSVSHDLKAPLRGIDGYSKLLLELYGKGLNDEAKIFLATIRSSTLQMNQLIDDLLEYSRLERSQVSSEKIKIKDLISSIISVYKNELNLGNYSLKVDVPDIKLVADLKGLTIALRNILENAIKFTKGKANPAIEIGLEEKATSWIIRVKDNGIGFDMKYEQRIFEIFQRLQRAEDFQGTGIGLAMVSKAMQKMGGKAWAESAPGIGSTFYLGIPKTNLYADNLSKQSDFIGRGQSY